MALIREIVQQALNTGYLSVASEEQLRQLLRTDFDEEEFQALVKLRTALYSGAVKQESQVLHEPQARKKQRRIIKMKLVCETAACAVILATVVCAVQ